MKSLSILIKLSLKFYKKYAKEYFELMLKPILVGLVGVLPLILVLINPGLAFISLLVAFPCICYGFWRGYVVTYSLNVAAYYFIRQESLTSIKNYYETILKKEKDFALYVSFFAIVCLLACVPTIYIFFKQVPLSEIVFFINSPEEFLHYLKPVSISAIVTSILLIPFSNYATQAYTFKKNESYIELFLNCYKKLDATGFLIAFVFSLFSFVLSSFLPIVYMLTFIVINVFIYSINTFWYYSRIFKTNINKN